MESKKGFQKGHEKTGGKVKGTPNKLTKSVKECFETVFNDLQAVPEVRLMDWAQLNTTDFYKLCARLIPASMDVTSKGESIAPNPPTVDELRESKDKLDELY